MSEKTPLSSAVHAFTLILAMILEDLEKAGQFSRKDFAARLRGMLDDAEKDRPPPQADVDSLDLLIARAFADQLAPRPRPTRWTPVVYSGGLDTPDEAD